MSELTVTNGSLCPICTKGKLIFAAVWITCCVCQKMWLEYEFIADWQAVEERRQLVLPDGWEWAER